MLVLSSAPGAAPGSKVRSAAPWIFRGQLWLSSAWQGCFPLLITECAAQSPEREIKALQHDLVFHFLDEDNIPRTQLSNPVLLPLRALTDVSFITQPCTNPSAVAELELLQNSW